jgi:sugar lactone lactonase YvrE
MDRENVSGSAGPSTARAGIAVAATTEQEHLGEGARWDGHRDELLRVDILRGRVYRDTVAADGSLTPVAAYVVGTSVGAVAPIADDDGWLVAAGRELVHLTPGGATHSLELVSAPGTRMNDGGCDPAGRFWVGSLAEDHRPGGGTLYRLDRDGTVEPVLDGLTISNGLGWSPDGTTMYLVDSVPGVVHAFDYDLTRGTLAGQRTLVAFGDGDGVPDGMTVDAAGDLWVAVYGGAQVRRYSPDGELLASHPIPAAQSTSCAFAGRGLDVLYVTTGTEDWDDEMRAADPAAGLVYRLDPGTTGRPAAPFRPDPAWWREATSGH